MVVFRKPVVLLLVVATMGIAGFVFFFSMHYRIYLIHTGSMSPTIPVGSAVVVREGPVHIGEVITFRPLDGSTVVTHRLIGINPNGTLVTKGDANKTPDVGIVTRANVIGAVVGSVPVLGTWINFAFHTRAGLLFDALGLLILAVLLGGFERRPAATTPASDSPAPGSRATDPRGLAGRAQHRRAGVR